MSVLKYNVQPLNALFTLKNLRGFGINIFLT